MFLKFLTSRKSNDFREHANEVILNGINDKSISKTDLIYMISLIRGREYLYSNFINQEIFNEVSIKVNDYVGSHEIKNKDFAIILKSMNSDKTSIEDCKYIFESIEDSLTGYGYDFVREIILSRLIPILHNGEFRFILSLVSELDCLIPVKSYSANWDDIRNHGELSLAMDFTYDHSINTLGLKRKISNAFYNAAVKSDRVSYHTRVVDNLYMFRIVYRVRFRDSAKLGNDTESIYKRISEYADLASLGCKDLASIIMLVIRDCQVIK